jgi:primosomal protein N' (replication factor Y)
MNRSLARRLRSNPTEAERRLWHHLRRRQLGGFRFRRQHPIGSYITDFVCLAARLIVEVDGGQHADSPADIRRTAWLESRGYRVLRFWNSDVLTNTDGVLTVIRDALAEGGRRRRRKRNAPS